MENSAEVPAGQRAGRDRKGKPQKGTGKQRGELAEMGFMFKAAGLGFGVAKPCGDSERYDFILDSGKRLWRVQAKSTYVARAHSYAINAMGGRRGKTKAYTAEQIDALVAYIVAEDAWYVIPVEALTGRARLQFYPTGSQYGGFYEKYREAWDLMKQDQSVATSTAPGRREARSSHERPHACGSAANRVSWIDAPNAAA